MALPSSLDRREQASPYVMAKTYVYSPLHTGDWFRFLQIYPGRDHDSLRCSLFECELSNVPPYKALSYVWGEIVGDSEITCSGYSLRITSSLFQGLCHIRNPTHTVTIWADAICIDQSNAVEKGHQVDLMGKIYEKAEEVLVWLGEDDSDSAKHAFGSLININAAIQKEAENHLRLNDTELGTDQKHSLTFERAFKSAKGTISSELGISNRNCIRTLYSLSWFKRVWVLQEVGLAKVATAMWGNSTVNFSQIALFVYFCAILEGLKQLLGPEIAKIVLDAPYHALWNIWCTFDKDTWVHHTSGLKPFIGWLTTNCDIDFVLVLEASKRFDASNPLDHVYAFLGHPKATLPGTNEPILLADYSLQVGELNRLVASRLARQSLNFLVQVQHPLNKDLTSGNPVPSWIPQWDFQVKDAPTAFWEFWDASLRKENKSVTKFQIIGNKLKVSAVFIGVIHLRTNIFREPSNLNLGKVIEECWNLIELAEEKQPQAYAKGVLEAFSSVMGCSSHQTNMERRVAGFCELCSHCNSRLYVEKVSRKLNMAIPTQILETRKHFGAMELLQRAMQHYYSNRRFFTTDRGFWGLGDPTLQTGDICAILFGADVPFILRSIGGLGKYTVIGHCYISGVMHGEMIQKWQNSQHGVQWTQVTLI